MSDPKPDAKSISRRDFAVSAALATVAIATVSADLLAQEKPAAEAAKPEAPQPPKLSAASQAEVEERYTAILRKYAAETIRQVSPIVVTGDDEADVRIAHSRSSRRMTRAGTPAATT